MYFFLNLAKKIYMLYNLFLSVFYTIIYNLYFSVIYIKNCILMVIKNLLKNELFSLLEL